MDLNPLAVRTAKTNVELNGLEETIAIHEGQAEDFANEKADLILANIHYEVISRMIDSGGFQGMKWLILSGLMRSQARKVQSELEKYHLKIMREWEHEAIWHTMLVENKCQK